MATTIAIVNRKGGVAKTTTVSNLAHELADLGQRVLMVDADGQANLTTFAGCDWTTLQEEGLTLGEVLLAKVSVEDVLVAENGSPHLLPAGNRLDDLVVEELIRRNAEIDQLRLILERLEANYDYILIDSPPSLSLITKNVIAAADYTIVPVGTDARSLEGLTSFFDTYFEIQESANPDLEVLCILPTNYDWKRITNRRALKYIPRLAPPDVPIFEPVQHSGWFDNAAEKNVPVRAVNRNAAVTYRRLAEYIIEH